MMTATEVMDSVREHGYTHFADDQEKMVDFDRLDQEDFLFSYSYLTEAEYRLTLWERQARMPELYHSERFYVFSNGAVTWMWHNPDSDCGDTFEYAHFNGANMLANALCVCETAADVFEYVLEHAPQYGSDAGTYGYEACKRMFEKDKPFAVGATEETLEKLKDRLGLIPPMRYSDFERSDSHD